MSDQGFNKVDLSLDDIIKLSKKRKQQQNHTRGGNARGRGGVRGRGQGLRGQRTRGIGRGRGSVSPLNRQKTGTVSTTAALVGQGQAVRRRGQRGNLRGVVGSRGGLRGGLTRRSRGGGSGQVMNTRGANVRGVRGNLRIRGTRGNLRGTLRGQGNLTSQGQGQEERTQGQDDSLTNRISLKQKRQLALQTLQLARKTIVQLDQQTARQNFVNARRGIAGQQTQPLKATGMYSSNMSLASTKSVMSLTTSRQLQGTQVTTFNPVRSQQNPRGRRRWRPKSRTNLANNSTTLTISIDNSTPLSMTDYSTPQVTVPVPAAPQQRQRRRPWRRQNKTNNNNNNNNNSNSMAVPDNPDLSTGASAEFSQQLLSLKPAVSTKYVFQKKAFSTANTSCSLNDRFSGTSAEVLMGRKVFL